MALQIIVGLFLYAKSLKYSILLVNKTNSILYKEKHMPRVDRSYSQFEEIRNYHDRSMMKWQGFFLSEHTASMKEDKMPKVYYKHYVKGVLK